MRRPKRSGFSAAGSLLALVLLAAACTGDQEPPRSRETSSSSPTPSTTPPPLPSERPITVETKPLRLDGPSEGSRSFARGWSEFDTGEDALGGSLIVVDDQLLLHHGVPYGSGVSNSYSITSDGRTWNGYGKEFGRNIGVGGVGVRKFIAREGNVVAAGTFHDFREGRGYEIAVVFTSTDGKTFREVLKVPKAGIEELTYIDGTFVAVGEHIVYTRSGPSSNVSHTDTHHTAWVSEDGIRWREDARARRSYIDRSQVTWRGETMWIGHGDPRFSLYHRVARERAFVSTPRDPYDQTVSFLETNRPDLGGGGLGIAAATDERIVALGLYQIGPENRDPIVAASWTSVDGRNWTRCVGDAVEPWEAEFNPAEIAAIDDRFVAMSHVRPDDDDVGYGDDRFSMWMSEDGCRWKRIPDPPPVTRADDGLDDLVAMGDSLFVLGGYKTDRTMGMKGPARRLHVWRWEG